MIRPLTESEWDAARDPFSLLDHLFPMRGDDSAEAHSRASQLYLIACARRAWDRLPACGRALVELAEQATDRDGITDTLRYAARAIAEELVGCMGDPEDLDEASRKLRAAGHIVEYDATPHRAYERDEWRSLSHLIHFPFAKTTPNYRRILTDDHSVELLRDVFRNPFQEGRLLADWRTSAVVGLAKGMYRSRDFGPLPLLADALQESGCGNECILEHCRSGGPHIRGCWVVEGILHPPRLR